MKNPLKNTEPNKRTEPKSKAYGFKMVYKKKKEDERYAEKLIEELK